MARQQELQGDAAPTTETRTSDRFRVTRRSRITGGRRSRPAAPSPELTRVASFGERGNAAAFVDRLVEQGVDVAGARIVGSDLRVVEQVRGPSGWVRSITNSAATGVLFGMLLGLLLGLFDPVAPGTSAFFGMLFGGVLGLVFGAVWGAVAYSLQGRDQFDSRMGLVAGRYDVLVERDAEQAARAAIEPKPPLGTGPA